LYHEINSACFVMAGGGVRLAHATSLKTLALEGAALEREGFAGRAEFWNSCSPASLVTLPSTTAAGEGWDS
jgi:hypothetical protein